MVCFVTCRASKFSISAHSTELVIKHVPYTQHMQYWCWLCRHKSGAWKGSKPTHQSFAQGMALSKACTQIHWCSRQSRVFQLWLRIPWAHYLITRPRYDKQACEPEWLLRVQAFSVTASLKSLCCLRCVFWQEKRTTMIISVEDDYDHNGRGRLWS